VVRRITILASGDLTSRMSERARKRGYRRVNWDGAVGDPIIGGKRDGTWSAMRANTAR